MTGRELVADVVMLIHAAFATFVVGGLVATVVGTLLGWTWTRRPAFVRTHMASALFIAVRAAAGIPCPLTWIEDLVRNGIAANCFAGATFHELAHALALRGMPTNQFAFRAIVFGALVMAVHLIANRAALFPWWSNHRVAPRPE